MVSSAGNFFLHKNVKGWIECVNMILKAEKSLNWNNTNQKYVITFFRNMFIYTWNKWFNEIIVINWKFLLTKTLLNLYIFFNLYFYATFLKERGIDSILLSTICFTSLLLFYHYAINIHFLAAFGSKTILEVMCMRWSMKKETHSKCICKYTQLLFCLFFCPKRREFYIKLVRQRLTRKLNPEVVKLTHDST